MSSDESKFDKEEFYAYLKQKGKYCKPSSQDPELVDLNSQQVNDSWFQTLFKASKDKWNYKMESTNE